MKFSILGSDHLYAWSDANLESSHGRLTKTPPGSPAAITSPPSDPAGFPHRALQTLWQAGVQCAQGPGHGPKYYLSVSYPRLRPQMDYVPRESYALATEFLANYHRAREILEAVCEINRELLRRRKAP
jgi:hypothetical protein